MSYDYPGMLRDVYEDHFKPRGSFAVALFLVFMCLIAIPTMLAYTIARVFWPVFVVAACVVLIWRM